MEDRSIEDSQITASSYFTVDSPSHSYKPHLARLNNEGSDCWGTADTHPSDPWIQVDFIDSVELYGIQTQGFYFIGSNSPYSPSSYVWVKMLQVQTGDSENSLTFIKDGSGSSKVNTTQFYKFYLIFVHLIV